MQSRLYFICPSDHIEPIINCSFKSRNYYYTSLGNSVVFDHHTVNQIEHLILKHDIKEISFVLSDTNPIIFDALGKQDFSGIRGLNDFYDEILRQKEHSQVLWRECNRKFLILSYYLNYKIRELQSEIKQPDF